MSKNKENKALQLGLLGIPLGIITGIIGVTIASVFGEKKDKDGK